MAMKKFILLCALASIATWLTSCTNDGEYKLGDGVVYYSHWMFSFGTLHDTLPDADPATFEAVKTWLGHDAKHAYFKAKLIPGVDVATLKAVKYPVCRDKKDYYYENVPMHVADVESFEFIKWLYDGDFWAKDSRYVYYDSLRVDSADVATFNVVKSIWARDKYHVFRFGKLLPDADPATYDEGDYWGYSMDRNHVWFYGELLKDVDRATFEVDDAEHGLAHDKFGPIEDGKRPGQVEEDDSVVVEEPEPEPEPVP